MGCGPFYEQTGPAAHWRPRANLGVAALRLFFFFLNFFEHYGHANWIGVAKLHYHVGLANLGMATLCLQFYLFFELLDF